MLTERQVNDFEQSGFLVLPRAVSAERVASLREAAGRIVDDFDIDRHRTVFRTTDRDAGRDEYFFASAERVHCFLEEHALNADGQLTVPKSLAINKIGHALHDHVPEFAEFCRSPVVSEAMRDLGMARPLVWQTMYIFKQPRIGGEVRWHQDASYLATHPPGVIGLWIALEDSNLDNGCLWMAPGAHRGPLRELYEVDWERRGGRLTTLDETPWPSSDRAVALEVPAGSVVYFDDHMPHYSSANRSEKSRHAFTVHCADASIRWVPGNWLQRPRLGPFAV